jgi:hypothetical protein
LVRFCQDKNERKALKPFFLSFTAKKETKQGYRSAKPMFLWEKLSRRVKKLPGWEFPGLQCFHTKKAKLVALRQLLFLHVQKHCKPGFLKSGN